MHELLKSEAMKGLIAFEKRKKNFLLDAQFKLISLSGWGRLFQNWGATLENASILSMVQHQEMLQS